MSEGDLCHAIEARVRPTICPTFGAKGATVEGRITEVDRYRMARIAEVLGVMQPNRAYNPHYIASLVEGQWRREYPNDPPRECKGIHALLARMVDSGRLTYLGHGGYALPAKQPKPKKRRPKKKKANLPRPSTTPGKVALKPPSVLYRARRMGLAD